MGAGEALEGFLWFLFVCLFGGLFVFPPVLHSKFLSSEVCVVEGAALRVVATLEFVLHPSPSKCHMLRATGRLS